MPGRIGLYYPWIHFRDEEWVKLSMLYWKQLRRIVPDFYSTSDGSFVRELAHHGLIENVSPSNGSRPDTFLRFVELHVDELRKRYGVDHFSVETTTPETTQVDESRLAFIHVTKMTRELREALISFGLGIGSRGNERNWVGVHPKLANVYMTALAEEISRRLGLNPVTEEEFSLVAVGGWPFERLASALLQTTTASEAHELLVDNEPVATLAFSAIRTVVPADLHSLTAEKILEIRAKYGDELIRFQDAIRVAVEGAGLTSIEDAREYEERLKETYADYVSPQVKQLEHDLKLFKVDTVYSYLNVKTTLPPVAAGFLTELKVDEPVPTAAAAMLLGIGTVSKGVIGRHRATLAGNPMAYMYRLKHSFQPQRLRARISEALAQFSSPG